MCYMALLQSAVGSHYNDMVRQRQNDRYTENYRSIEYYRVLTYLVSTENIVISRIIITSSIVTRIHCTASIDEWRTGDVILCWAYVLRIVHASTCRLFL